MVKIGAPIAPYSGSIRENYICISMALTLSPRKYFSGKFCFSFLKRHSIAQRLRYVSQICSADISF